MQLGRSPGADVAWISADLNFPSESTSSSRRTARVCARMRARQQLQRSHTKLPMYVACCMQYVACCMLRVPKPGMSDNREAVVSDERHDDASSSSSPRVRRSMLSWRRTQAREHRHVSWSAVAWHVPCCLSPLPRGLVVLGLKLSTRASALVRAEEMPRALFSYRA